ncbi:magnesium transporter [Bowmanella sp. Y26]|uniref:magnesium transporter n=1 Tax=Bowmanella yangjiangensis TaxID=2811230 RepID=UPI001BDC9954|nr:magnesium transporter [Bowmanella yangjiangensis]MBT1065103.1 magnesium transporter [Bowmanella yangjiangensis]
MNAIEQRLDSAAEQLSQAYMANYPQKSARHLESMPAGEAAELLQSQPLHVIAALWKYLPVGSSDAIFSALPEDLASRLISYLDSHLAIGLLSRQPQESRDALLNALNTGHSALASEYRNLLEYPPDTAARMMTTKVQAFSADITAAEALAILRRNQVLAQDTLYVLDANQQPGGELSLQELVLAQPGSLLEDLAKPLRTSLNALDDKDTVIERFEGFRCRNIAVLDPQGQLIGSIGYFDVYQSTKEDLAADLQTMVGVSKEEKALSSSWFAFSKRQPWLQINLLTAFAAAAVVGAFEGLIAQVTALAILLPVAAGQSGNAGAQALAVTMRGLTLREITTKHWRHVLFKEMAAGAMNGIVIALTCAIGVYVWSQSIGLALVIALAMVSSLVIACSAGALVPIVLKKAGLDPAQSSSIVLTTITDIAGFMSFLGIALLLSDMLPKG